MFFFSGRKKDPNIPWIFHLTCWETLGWVDDLVPGTSQVHGATSGRTNLPGWVGADSPKSPKNISQIYSINGSLYILYTPDIPTNFHYLVVSTPLKNISQNGNLPQIGVKIKNIWVATTYSSSITTCFCCSASPQHQPTFPHRHLLRSPLQVPQVQRLRLRKLRVPQHPPGPQTSVGWFKGKKKSECFFFWKAWFFGGWKWFFKFLRFLLRKLYNCWFQEVWCFPFCSLIVALLFFHYSQDLQYFWCELWVCRNSRRDTVDGSEIPNNQLE